MRQGGGRQDGRRAAQRALITRPMTHDQTTNVSTDPSLLTRLVVDGLEGGTVFEAIQARGGKIKHGPTVLDGSAGWAEGSIIIVKRVVAHSKVRLGQQAGGGRLGSTSQTPLSKEGRWKSSVGLGGSTFCEITRRVCKLGDSWGGEERVCGEGLCLRGWVVMRVRRPPGVGSIPPWGGVHILGASTAWVGRLLNRCQRRSGDGNGGLRGHDGCRSRMLGLWRRTRSLAGSRSCPGHG